ncbi:polysaccharide export protein [Sphingomonas sp. H160509]|uniref:polysaccharide biosynthesis/export family protein n=1 Tax=Sphingomonas sp. H160509 TaxID=2955313 RepID=UPI0021E83F33|nr:polysaccharide biosynthesis/export family protein [Sphingomonas sp. H160509]MDD1453160.1 polysaccharide export protein [Sphingomonas sp. H160509]
MAAKPADVYRLGLGDKLRVNVYGEPALSGEYQIGGSGAVTMPLIGDVRAVGLSARELESALIQRYTAGYLKSPKIAVEVYDFRPYFILGEVQRPGRFPSTEATTVLGAIATAGGFSYRANKKRAFLRRAGTDQEYEIDLAKDVRILPGDVLRIGERYF